MKEQKTNNSGMKYAILLFAAVLFLWQTTHGQELSLSSVAGTPRFETYSLSNFASYGKQRKMCTVAKVGLISMGGGLVILSYGVGQALGTTSDPNNSAGIVLAAGAAIFIVGTGMAIGGGIHDISNRHKQKWGIIVPKRNQFGLAYNF